MKIIKSQRIKKLHEHMSSSGLDAVIATAPENVYYISNFRSVGQKVIPATQVYAVLTLDESIPWLIVPISDLPNVYESGHYLDRVIPYGNFYFGFYDDSYLARKIKDLSTKVFPDARQAFLFLLNNYLKDAVKIGIDRRNLNIEIWEQLKALQPQKEFSAEDALFYSIRRIKDEEEIEFLKKAAEIAEESLITTLKLAKSGMAEKQLKSIFENQIIKRGADNLFAVFTFGERAAFADTYATDRLLNYGDIIRCDVGCSYKGYKSDLSRCAVMGEPSKKQQKFYNCILAGQKEAIELIKPGVLASDVFKTAVDVTRNTGLYHYKRGHCGHGIGLEVYEPPTIKDSDDIALEAGMVLCVETPYYELGWGGVQVEDMVLVTDNGYRLLSKSDSSLIILGE